MDNTNTLEDFLQKMGPQFHTRLMLYHENLLKDEYKPDNDTILHFEFPEGEYSIRYGLLKERADEETLKLLDDNGLKINMGPLGSSRKRIEKKDTYVEVIPMKNDISEDANNGESV
jgi:hypothetical protein